MQSSIIKNIKNEYTKATKATTPYKPARMWKMLSCQSGEPLMSCHQLLASVSLYAITAAGESTPSKLLLLLIWFYLFLFLSVQPIKSQNIPHRSNPSNKIYLFNRFKTITTRFTNRLLRYWLMTEIEIPLTFVCWRTRKKRKDWNPNISEAIDFYLFIFCIFPFKNIYVISKIPGDR